MPVTISDMAKNECLKPFKIPAAIVEETAESPDQTERIKMDDNKKAESLLYVKNSKLMGKDVTVLLLAWREGPTTRIDLAFRIPEDMTQGESGTRTPLQMLEALADRFGLWVSVAGKRAKLILSESFDVPASGAAQVVHVENPNNVNFTQSFLVRHTAAGKIDCALAFAINRDAYVRWIGV